MSPAWGWAVIGIYGACVAVRAVGFGRAAHRARSIRASAVACRWPEPVRSAAERCVRDLGGEAVPILVSSHVAVPATIGVLRPIVVLPWSMMIEADEALLVTAIGHELAHVRRRDYAVHLVCELLAIPFVLHPAVTFVRRKLRETRELACDERVTERLLEAHVYARSLVEIARCAPAAAPTGHILGVVDADILEDRVMRCIRPTRRLGVRAGRFALGALLATLVVTGVFASSYSFDVLAAGGVAGQTSERDMVGQWNLYIWNDGDVKSEEDENGLPAVLAIDYDGSKLTGTATVWPVRKTENGKVVGDESQKHVMPLVEPKFDGRTFTFKVFNGEEQLLGELVLEKSVFTGRWVSSKSKLSGNLKLVRR